MAPTALPTVRSILESLPPEARKLQGRAALTYLARFLRKLPKELYDHRNWVRNGRISKRRDRQCGTAACAMGWGYLIFDAAPYPGWASTGKSFYGISRQEYEEIAYDGDRLHPRPLSPRTVETRIRRVLARYPKETPL